jgi:SAM-dependent methyltransferase
MMPQNKNHWYDGWFYDKIIAPNQDKLFRQIKNLIEPQSTIIDVGCGTGRLEFTLADKSKSVLGIDLSKRNIERANLSLLKHPDVKISFQHNNLSNIISSGKVHFDFAILAYVIHEINAEERVNLLRDISQVSDKIIVGDYLVPRPNGFGGTISELIEFIAGKEHYSNYKSYMADGGIFPLANKAGLKAIDEITNDPFTNHIVVLAK